MPETGETKPAEAHVNDLESRLFKGRKVMVFGQITDKLARQVYTEMLFAHQSCWLHVLVTVNFPVYPAGSVCSETGWSL